MAEKLVFSDTRGLSCSILIYDAVLSQIPQISDAKPAKGNHQASILSPASEPKTAESGTFQQGQVGDVSRAPFTDPKQYTAGDQSQDPVIYTQTGKTNWAAVSRDLVYLIQ